MTSPDTLVVTQSFVGNLDGADVIFRAGDSIAATHPAVRKWPQMFGERTVVHEVGAIEQATAAPGEKRRR